VKSGGTRRQFLYSAGGGLAALSARASAAVPQEELSQQVIPLNGADWQIAIDPKNEGGEGRWFEQPRGDAQPTQVPWVIQDIFHEYHGVAWYSREFTPPANPHHRGRYLLRFEAVDYLADVWLNGQHVGGHEGGETPFVLDVTGIVRANQPNRLAVRVLNPTYEPIDGFALKQTPSGSKQYPVQPNAVYNAGGIVDSVDLLMVPPVWLEDVYVAPDWQTGDVRVQVTVRNAEALAREVLVHVGIAPDRGTGTICSAMHRQSVPPGEGLLELAVHVENHRLWELSDPFLYRAMCSPPGCGERLGG
jgi:beta-galactosidase/beta-glucuronidase